MSHSLVRKLERLAPLSDAEKQALAGAVARTRSLQPDADIIRAGERPTECTVLLDGWACRYKLLPDGKRQITGFLIAGDVCDLSGLLMGTMDHSVGTLTAASVAVIPRDLLMGLMDSYPSLARALWQETLIEASIAREWVLNVGRRSGDQRIAHLLCEIGSRLRSVSRMSGHTFACPITQAEIADATGLSSVHVNRMLQDMRSEGLLVWKGNMINVLDWKRLQESAAFSPDYLFLNRKGETGNARTPVGFFG
jgi:CRP-like cAMP-binding protein